MRFIFDVISSFFYGREFQRDAPTKDMLVLNKSDSGEAGSSREAGRSAISSLSHQFFQLRGLSPTTAHYHTSRHTSCMESLHECLDVASVKDKVDRCSVCDCMCPSRSRTSTSTFTQLLSSVNSCSSSMWTY